MTDDQAGPASNTGHTTPGTVPTWAGAVVAAVILLLVLLGGLVLGARDGGDTTAPTVPEPPSATTSPAAPTVATSSTVVIDTTTTAAPETTAPTTTTTTTAPRRTTTTTTSSLPAPTTTIVNGVPVFEPYDPLPGIDGRAALTGLGADDEVTQRPILAVKVDNIARARPQWGLESADVVFEENVEQITRFVALFHTELPSRVGPVRSARTGDIDILSGLNRPVLAWSGGNPGVTRWIGAAADAGRLVDFTAQRNPCFARTSVKPAPHNLLLDPACALGRADDDADPGPARPLWPIDAGWELPSGSTAAPSGEFDVEMDGNRVTWRWDDTSGTYLRFQNGSPHVTQSGTHLAFANVIELFSPHLPSPVDARSPNPLTTGRDRAVVHRAGTTIEAVWERPSPVGPFRFIDAATGREIALAPGRTFVEITRNPAFG